MTPRRLLVLVPALATLACPGPMHLFAHPPQPTVHDQHARFIQSQYNTLKRVLTGSLEKMPDEHYGFAPTPDVRTFGALLGHVIFGNYLFCAEARQEPNPKPGINFETLKTKAELARAMQDALAYCDVVFDALTGDSLMEPISVAGPNNTRTQIPKANRLTFLIIHANEHYGNMVTYLRMKGLVPPSSERASAPGRSGGEPPRPALSGTWVVDIERTKAAQRTVPTNGADGGAPMALGGGGLATPASTDIVIALGASSFELVMSGVRASFPITGAETDATIGNTPVRAKAAWEGNRLAIDTMRTYPNGTSTARVYWYLDGDVLVRETTMKTFYTRK